MALALVLEVAATAAAVEDSEVAAAEEQHPDEDDSSTLAAPYCARRGEGSLEDQFRKLWERETKRRLTFSAEFSSLEQSCVFRSVGALVEGPYWPQMEVAPFFWSAAFSVRRRKRDYAQVKSPFSSSPPPNQKSEVKTRARPVPVVTLSVEC